MKEEQATGWINFSYIFQYCLYNFSVFFFSGKEDGAENRIARMQENNAVDEKYGFLPPKESGEKIEYLINMHTVILEQFIITD